MDYSPPGFSVHGDSPGKNTGEGSLTILQGIFPTQEQNQGLLQWRQIPYQLNQQGSTVNLHSFPQITGIVLPFWLNGLEFEQTLWDTERLQACCSLKEPDTT